MAQIVSLLGVFLDQRLLFGHVLFEGCLNSQQEALVDHRLCVIRLDLQRVIDRLDALVHEVQRIGLPHVQPLRQHVDIDRAELNKKALELDKKRGDYIKTVVLNSPGGSVADALAMGRLIRARKFATEVEAGAYCASSCPLVFAGGVERHAGDRAVIGVHQIAAIKSPAVNGPPRDEMSIAQNISARCERYLADMGVDMKVWIHAMETPHDRLFVFKPDEMKSLALVTAAPSTAKARL